MSSMFAECFYLEKIHKFSLVPNVINTSFMFLSCHKLKVPDENENFEFKFDISKITEMIYMFYDCKLISKKEISKYFDIKDFKKDKTGIFSGCKK